MSKVSTLTDELAQVVAENRRLKTTQTIEGSALPMHHYEETISATFKSPADGYFKYYEVEDIPEYETIFCVNGYVSTDEAGMNVLPPHYESWSTEAMAFGSVQQGYIITTVAGLKPGAMLTYGCTSSSPYLGQPAYIHIFIQTNKPLIE